MDANGGPCYIGSGCFHRRESLCGMKYDRKECGGLDQWREEMDKNEKQSAVVLEDMCKVLASCTYEDNTQWGREMGVKYGFPAEDIITGLSIQCRGWKSIYFNPERKSFTGVAPITLLQALVQQKRWSEGQFQIFLSKYCPLVYGRGRIPFNLRMCYAIYSLWAPNCLPTLYYVIVPSLFLLGDVSLFPEITSLWILPFAYVLIAKYGCSLAEFVTCGGTLQGWWNEQRIWLFRRTTSFCFAFLESIARLLGFTKLEFVVTAKVADSEVYQRYLQETMEFGSPSPMFTVLSTIAMINLLSFVRGLKRMITNVKFGVLEQLGLQIVLCGVIVLINLPVYKGLFFRRDKGKMPFSVMYKSVMLAFLACSIALYFSAFCYRYEKELPGVDVFVCTADPAIEPPIMVVNTVLSVMAYDYPPEKLAVYLSDDAGSELTFYALLEASQFAKHWLPFCKKFKVEPRSPAAYFSTVDRDDQEPLGDGSEYRSSVKKIYEEMRDRIDIATRLARIPSDILNEHEGFREWDSVSSARDHPAILQILIDGRVTKVVGIKNHDKLPTLVYLSREKRPHCHHNFKAGAMNALIRVSSKISNGPIILNVDCDVYSNNSESVRDAMCFFMDENKGHEIAYVQYPQSYNNLTRNDLHGILLRVINEVRHSLCAWTGYNNFLTFSLILTLSGPNHLYRKCRRTSGDGSCTEIDVDLAAMDANGGPCYIGSGCFHRRESLFGMKYDRKDCRGLEWREEMDKNEKQSAIVLEDMCKVLANCTYEDNTQWGREVYGCEIRFSSRRHNHRVVNTMQRLEIHLLQPRKEVLHGSRSHYAVTSSSAAKEMVRRPVPDIPLEILPLGLWPRKNPLQPSNVFAIYSLWAPNCLPTLYYVIVPSLFLVGDVSLFPEITSSWILPFAYVLIAKYGCSLAEFVTCGGTLQGWWNEQRIWLFRRTTSFCFAFLETIARQLGFTKLKFVVTAKVADSEVYQRYLQETMEFGSPSPMFTVLSTIAMINLLSFVWGLKRMLTNVKFGVLEQLGLQIVLCGVIVLINLPVYKGLFFRRDKGKMPFSVMYKSVMLAFLACSIALYLV
ncbi:hypothetical protein RHMOL_Rhmol02G0100300 [Rhododendron molle]|uniref:Uncharacterized protein n=1 Tax=Rhododendron molle TaxID=49168 RepID=A0ACC0PQ19_RHOML|nr:hypothetical protein RHMOL_Rhmol02G0100300 [Rhododendron molle]